MSETVMETVERETSHASSRESHPAPPRSRGGENESESREREPEREGRDLQTLTHSPADRRACEGESGESGSLASVPLAEPRHAVSPARAADEIPAWFVWASLVLVGGPSLFALAYFQHRLLADLWVGTPDAMTYSLAVAVDTFGAMSGVYWFRSHRNTTLRGWGRFFAVAAVLGSTALTCWAIARLFGGPAAVAGVIPAVIVFGTTKQVTMWQADRAKNRDVLAEAAAQVADAEARAQAGQDRADAAEAEREGLAGRLAALEERLSSSEERTVRAERVASEDTGPIPAARSLAEASAGSKTERARAFIRAEWKAGREPSGGEVDAHVGGKSLGRAQIRWLRERGEFPPSERGDRHLASA